MRALKKLPRKLQKAVKYRFKYGVYPPTDDIDNGGRAMSSARSGRYPNHESTLYSIDPEWTIRTTGAKKDSAASNLTREIQEFVENNTRLSYKQVASHFQVSASRVSHAMRTKRNVRQGSRVYSRCYRNNKRYSSASAADKDDAIIRSRIRELAAEGISIGAVALEVDLSKTTVRKIARAEEIEFRPKLGISTGQALIAALLQDAGLIVRVSKRPDIVINYRNKIIIVELDGAFWHQDAKRDNASSLELLAECDTLIRVRLDYQAHSCPEIEIYDNMRLIGARSSGDFEYVESVSAEIYYIVTGRKRSFLRNITIVERANEVKATCYPDTDDDIERFRSGDRDSNLVLRVARALGCPSGARAVSEYLNIPYVNPHTQSQRNARAYELLLYLQSYGHLPPTVKEYQNLNRAFDCIQNGAWVTPYNDEILSIDPPMAGHKGRSGGGNKALSKYQVDEIRRRFDEGNQTFTSLAREYDVSQPTIRKVIKRTDGYQ